MGRRMDEKGARVFVNSVHPGGVRGNLIKGTQMYEVMERNLGSWFAEQVNQFIMLFYWSELDGSLTSLFPATSPKIVSESIKGRYMVPIARTWETSAHGKNVTLATALWELSDRLLAERGF